MTLRWRTSVKRRLPVRAIILSSTAYTHCCAEVSPVDPLAEYDDEELEAGAAGQELLEGLDGPGDPLPPKPGG